MNTISLFLFDILNNRKTSYYLREFKKAQGMSKSNIRHYQFNKIKNLLLHAEANVPFYQERFRDSDFSANNFTKIEQLKKIPPLSREEIQKRWKDIISSKHDIKKLSKGSSSGSTGLPVTYFKDNIATSAGQAAQLLGWSLSGWKMNMKGLHIWGNPSTVNKEWKRLSSRIKAKVFRHHKFPAYKLTDSENFKELFDLINRGKYDFIDGYTNAIYLFADFLEQNHKTLNHKVKYVLTTAEVLHDFQRKKIEKMIAPVYDAYGCSEINGIAYECSKCGFYHIIDPHVYVEFHNTADNIELQELLITDLDNYAFPLIRYKNNDLGVPNLKENNCEIQFSQIRSIAGRHSDIIRLKDGGTLSVPSFFGSMLLKQVDGLKQYQIEKVSDDLIFINIVRSREFSEKDYKKIQSALNEYLGNRISYKIKFLQEIKSSTTGKFKLLIDKTKL